MCVSLLNAQLPSPAARHWAYEAARRQWHRCLLRAAMRALRAATEATAEQLAHFWLRWQAQAPLRRALLGWHWAVQARHEQRVRCGIADVHRERRLLQTALAAFAAADLAPQAALSGACGSERAGPAALCSVSSTGGGCVQHPRQASQCTVDVVVSSRRVDWQRQQQQQQQRFRHGGGATTTVTISREPRQWSEQEQVPPAASACSCPAAATRTSCSAANGAASVAAAAQGMLEAVSSWRAAADFWRQRHASLSQQQLQQR